MPVRKSYRSGLSGKNAMACLACTGRVRMELPATMISPSVKSRTPATARSVVDLPAPLWPRNPQISPGATCSVRSCTA